MVTFDARGHGRSGKPSSGYGFDQTVADTLAVIRATRARPPVLVGHSWGAMVALEVAARHERAIAGLVLVDGGISRMRDAFPTWQDAKTALAPPHLAGMPEAEFRAMIPMFFGDAVTVTPEVEDIVMAVMRVGRDGTIRPRLSRANHFRILHAIWNQDPPALHADLRVPGLAILAGGGDPEWDAAPTGGRGGDPLVRRPAPRGLARRDPRPPAATPGCARSSDRIVRADRRRIGACWSSC